MHARTSSTIQRIVAAALMAIAVLVPGSSAAVGDGDSLAKKNLIRHQQEEGGGHGTEYDRQIEDGWTVFAPHAETRLVYVSASEGDDANDGLDPARPVRSLARGYELLREGRPDWLLLKRGDVWENETLGMWRRSGISPDAPVLISSYGEDGPRPLIRTGSAHAFQTKHDETVRHVAIVGVAFEAHERTTEDSCVAIRWLASGGGLLVEDCLFRSYATNIVIQDVGGAGLEDIRIRRSIVIDAYTSGGHAQGLFCKDAHGILIEGCLFDHNGWKAQEPGAERTIFNHNIYIQNDCTDVTVRDNIISRGASHGLQARPGATIEDNVFIANAIAILLGGGDHPNEGGVEGAVRGNLVLYSDDIAADLPRGHGLTLQNIRTAVIEGNILLDDRSAYPYGHAVYFEGGQDGMVGVHDVTVADNVVYNWRGGLKFRGEPGAELSGIVIRDNLIQNHDGEKPLVKHDAETDPAFFAYARNVYHSEDSPSNWFEIDRVRYGFEQWRAIVEESNARGEEIAWADTARSIASYHAEVGGEGSLEAFLESMRRQRKGAWTYGHTADAVNQYFRTGFRPANDG